MVFCTEFLDGWWSWEPLRRSCVHRIQKLGAENHMLQLNIQCSWWWAYVPETFRAKNTLIKSPCCIKLAFQIISRLQIVQFSTHIMNICRTYTKLEQFQNVGPSISHLWLRLCFVSNSARVSGAWCLLFHVQTGLVIYYLLLILQCRLRCTAPIQILQTPPASVHRTVMIAFTVNVIAI